VRQPGPHDQLEVDWKVGAEIDRDAPRTSVTPRPNSNSVTAPGRTLTVTLGACVPAGANGERSGAEQPPGVASFAPGPTHAIPDAKLARSARSPMPTAVKGSNLLIY
jgi:hypothetical protein